MPLDVLLFYDDATMREMLRSPLRSHRDIRIVAEADDRRRAVGRALQLGPDVVVAGVSAAMDGVEVTRAIVERGPDIPVLVVLRHDSAGLIARAFRAGARGVLLGQHWAARELLDALKAVAGGTRYLGAGVVDRVFDSFQKPRSELDAVKSLTAAELRILQRAADGISNARIAEELELSPRTVETYRARLMRKLGLDGVPSLVKFAIRHGLTELD